MSDRLRASIPILLVAVLVATVDLALVPIFQIGGYLPDGAPTIAVLVWDFATVLAAGLAGLFLAPRVGCPLWWRSGDASPPSRRTTIVTLLLSLVLVAYNTVAIPSFAIVYRDQAATIAPWMSSLTPGRAMALAFRAAQNEEVIFRFFLFPLVAWGVRHFVRSRRVSLVTGAMASSLFFGLIHPGFFPAFLMGLALVYIYHQRGLLPAMVVHFFTDAIPYVLVSLLT